MNPLHTIGYFNRPVSEFIGLLKACGVNVICDVRSSPYSKRNPDFSRDELRAHLRQVQIKYVFLGEELGARPPEPECYIGGQARYELLARRKAFHDGIQRVLTGLENYRPALMCAERDPMECHRAILVCRHLISRSVNVQHIMGMGNIERHSELERRLVRTLGLEPPPMFASDDAWTTAIADAYELQGRKIAYVDKSGVAMSADGPMK